MTAVCPRCGTKTFVDEKHTAFCHGDTNKIHEITLMEEEIEQGLEPYEQKEK